MIELNNRVLDLLFKTNLAGLRLISVILLILSSVIYLNSYLCGAFTNHSDWAETILILCGKDYTFNNNV